jgi:hypothetical protein
MVFFYGFNFSCLRVFILSFFLGISLKDVNGQVSTYSFAATSGTYTPITGGTLIVDGTTSLDSYVSSAVTIPTFTFNTINYTTSYVTSNGILSLGNPAPSATATAAMSSSTGGGISICPFSADLDRVNATNVTQIRYEEVGNELVFQWTQFKRKSVFENFDFQVRLNKINGVITFVYNLTSGPGIGITTQPQVGIRSSTSGYKNLIIASGTETWANPNMGTANNNTCRFTSSAPSKSFTSGQTYTWTPSLSCTGTPSPGNTVASSTTACYGGSSITLSLQNTTSGTGVSYLWQSSSDGNTWSNIASGGTSDTYSPTVSNPTYFRCGVTCSGNTTYSNSQLITIGSANSLPYNEGFESITAPSIPTCTAIQNAGGGNNWATSNSPGSGFTSKCLSYTSSASAANAWFYTKAISLVAGTTYQLTFNYGNNSTNFLHKLKVAYGSSAISSSMTNTIVDIASINQATIQTSTTSFTPTASGVYYVGFNVYSSASQLDLYLDDIAINVCTTCNYSISRNTGITFNSIISSGSDYSTWSGGSKPGDDEYTNTVALTGTTFKYFGLPVTGFVASTNGFISLASLSNSLPGNDLTNASSTKIIAPFWDDLVIKGASTSNRSIGMRYKIIGTLGSGNADIIIEWAEMEKSAYSDPNINFQIVLHELNNTIEFNYGNMQLFNGTSNPSSGFSYSVGLNNAWPSSASTTQRIILQAENSNYFLATSQNSLSYSIACNSQYIFTPSLNFSSGAVPTSGQYTSSAFVPTNNELASATTIAVNSTACTSNCGNIYSSKNASATTGIPTCNAVAPGVADDDVFFKFTTTSATNYRIAVDPSYGYDAVVQILDASQNPVLCTNQGGAGISELIISQVLTPNSQYYLRVYDAATGSSNTGEFSVCISEVILPTNDDPTGATTINVGATCSATSSQLPGTLNASSTSGIGACNATIAGTPDDDVWYKFTTGSVVNTTYTIVVAGVGTYDAVLQLFSGTPGSLLSIDCVNATGIGGTETINTNVLNTNTTYYARVYHSGLGAASGNFNICVFASAPTCLNNPISPLNGANLCVASNTILSWNSVANATGYNVYLGLGGATTLVSSNQSGTTYTPTNLSAGSYTWLVQPINGTSASAACTSWTFTINSPLLSTPTNGTYVFGAFNSTDFNVATNWYVYSTIGDSYSIATSLPLSSNNIIIPSSRTCVLSNSPTLSADVSITNLEIQSGAKLILNGNSLTLNGSASGTGTITGSSSSNLIIAGSAGTLNFTSGSRTLKFLTLNANAIATLGTPLEITAGVTPGIVLVGSSATLNTNNNLTLKSNASGTASIGNVLGTINGNVTVERFIPANRAFRFLTPSVTTSNSIKANWQEGATSSSTNPNIGYGTHITGSTIDQTNGFDGTLTGASSMFTYSDITGWNSISNTNSNILKAGSGYRVLIRGSRAVNLTSSTPIADNTILRATGALLTGSVTMNSTGLGATPNMPTLSAASNGFSLVGNPYASPVSWSSIYASSSNISSYYYAWDPNMSISGSKGAYVSCDNNGITNNGVSAVSDKIQSGQAFFIKNLSSLSSSPSLVFNESHKTTGNTNVFKIQNQNSILSLQLFLNDGLSTNQPQDGVTIVCNDNYNNMVNDDDASKMTNPNENIAVEKGNSLMSIEKRSQPQNTNDTIQLKLWQLTENNYTLRINGSNFNSGINAYLQDVFLNTETLLNLNGTTDIGFNNSNTVSNTAANRFRIVFKSNAVLGTILTSIKAYQTGSNAAVEWVVTNETNLNRYEVETSTDAIHFYTISVVLAINKSSYSCLHFNPSSNNYYRIKMVDKSGKINYSQVVNLKIGGKISEYSVYPNPVSDGWINVQMNNVDKGVYTIKFFNSIGQEVAAKNIDYLGGSASQTVCAAKNLAKGMYTIQIINSKKYIVNTQKIVVE